MNIHVYKTVDKRGFFYTMKSKEGCGSLNAGCISTIAHVAKIKLNDLLEKAEQVSIDFSPFHDIEWSSGSDPVRCFTLSKEEQEIFWLHFLKN
jgi:hypothetical protein